MRIKLFAAKNFYLPCLGYTLAGLYAQPDTTITLHLVNWINDRGYVALEVDDLKLGIELSDHSDYWDEGLLNWCDVYAKRNINPLHPAPVQHKVIPFGLNWLCHSRHSAMAVMMAMASNLPRASKEEWREIYCYLAAPHWRAFEHRPDQAVEDTILFQTRVWEHHDAPGDETVNERRVSLLRALRREFGDRVRGGIVNTPFARQHYPDLITDQQCRQPQYIRWAKIPLIGVYSRGLYDSLAYKMAEFLAASKCIVSEPIINELVEPLDSISVYRTEDECLAFCDRLLGDKSLAEYNRRQSWDYYQRLVRPQAGIANLLSRALEFSQNKGKANDGNRPSAPLAGLHNECR